MNIFGFRPFKGKFNLGNSDDIPENQDGTLIGSIKQINNDLTKHGLGTPVSITAAYTFTSDGYLLVATGNTARSSASLYLNSGISVSVTNDANGGRSTNTVFVRKDMFVSVPTLVGSGSVTFYPLA